MENTDNKQKRLWKYAVIVSDTKGNLYVKDGDHRCETQEDVIAYAAGETTGKIQGLMKFDDLLGVWDMTDHAKTIGKDPTVDVDASRGYDNEIRANMPLPRKLFKNFMGKSSYELHPIPKDYIKKEGDNWRELLAHEWDLAHKNLLEDGDIYKEVYNARPYLLESFKKIKGLPEGNKFLLASATGTGKETSTLALLIYNHDQKQYDNTKLNVSVATIPSTTSESFNELGTVSGMNVGDYGFVDFSRIKSYITEQWYKAYYPTCSKFAKFYISKFASIVNSVSEIPATHEDGVVPVLFGSFHDLALKSDENKIDKRYAGLDKRIGTLAIGEAHQMLSNADNKMWKSLNNVFGKNCSKLFITGTPYDFIYGNAAAESFGPDERSLFTRNDLYNDKRNNPNSDYKDYPDYNFYGIDVRDIVDQMKKDNRWEGDENGFTFNKLFTYDPEEKNFIYEESIVKLFRRMFGMDGFSENGDPLSIYNAPELCPVAKRHGMIALPTGNKNASAKDYISALKNLLVEYDVFPGDVFCSYKDDLGDRKDVIANAKGRTLTLTCNKDCTGANIPELGYFVFMRKLGDSVKFFEQATGRVGRKYPEKTNCGVFLADLENSMNVMLTIEEKIAADRDENSSVREIIEELLANYNFFTGRNGKWESLEPEDFSKVLEELNAKGNYGINQCLRNTDPDEEFDLFFEKINNSDRKRIDINSNGNKGAKNSNRNFVLEEMKLPVDKEKSFKQNWINIKLIFASKCRMLAFLKGAETVQDCVEIIQKALDQNDEGTLKIVDENVKGVEWFPVIMTDEHIDVRYTNRWIQKFNDNCENVENLLEMLSDPIHRTKTLVAESNIFLEKIANKVIQILKNKNGASFIDPCAGRGGFIVYILKLAEKNNIKIDLNKVYYNDNDPNMVRFFKHLNKKYNLGIPEDNITSEDFFEMEFNMKFDVGIINPPYDGKFRCHQKFFNKLFSLIEEDGVMACLQPATTYFNKKSVHLSESVIQEMIDIIKKNTSEVEIENAEIFGNARIQNDLSITYIIKDGSNTGVIDKLTYKNSNSYTKVPLEYISQTGIDPTVYESIKNKYERVCASNGNLEDIVSKKPDVLKAPLPKIRGTLPKDSDFYTFIPKVEKNFLKYYNEELSDFGIMIEDENYKDNVYDYLKSYVARFGLALLKFSQNTKNKEFALVPIVDFKKKYTDEDLFNLLGLTTDEVDTIKKVISNYYDR